MSGLAIYFPQTPASKRTPSSPSPCEWPSKRRRLTRTNKASTVDSVSSTKMNWHAVYIQKNSSHNRASPPASTEFVTPPNSCELPNSSPSPAHTSWVGATGSPLSENQDSGESTIFFGSSLDLIPTIMSFPIPPFHGDNTPSPSIIISPNSHTSSEVCTPAKVPCPPTCFCRLDLPMDTFGNRCDVERAQLTQKTSPSHGGCTVSPMLFPRSTWSLFRTSTSEGVHPKRRPLVYRGHNSQGRAFVVENEDLWMDEKNPFLLTQFDLRLEELEQLARTIIPTTSSLNLL